MTDACTPPGSFTPGEASVLPITSPCSKSSQATGGSIRKTARSTTVSPRPLLRFPNIGTNKNGSMCIITDSPSPSLSTGSSILPSTVTFRIFRPISTWKSIHINHDILYCRLANLRLIPGEENRIQSSQKFTAEEVVRIRERCAAGEYRRKIARELGVAESTIRRIADRTCYKEIP